MKNIIETERLYLRELDFQDELDLFEMDSDPDVHLYIENKPVTDISQITHIIGLLKKQYEDFGIARWAVIDKNSNECLGWCGLKYFNFPLNNHSNFYEHGYRFKKKHWGKGYATESSLAILNYGFENLQINSIYALTDPKNEKSIHVLEKLGFEFIELFDYEGDMCNWFELKKENFIRK
jgi:ribosomal-protein-alanine N-acetyltransferase